MPVTSPPPSLVLVHGSRVLSLTRCPVAIGRLRECDLVLDGIEVSRRHARIVPTAGGALLVDRSRHGTRLNGMEVVAPALLAPGDVIEVGSHRLVIETGPAPVPAEHPPGWRDRVAAWRRRYGAAELVGTAALVTTTLAVHRAVGGVVLAAYAGTLAEAVWFYGLLAARDYRRETDRGDSTERPGPRLARVLHNLGREFGLAEGFDGLLLRPLALGLGLGWLGGWVGVLAGKILADTLFYGPVLHLAHWRRDRRRPPRPDSERHRPTSRRLPLIPR